jgi:hypothetical protein
MMGGNNAEIGVPDVDGEGVDGPASSGDGMFEAMDSSGCCRNLSDRSKRLFVYSGVYDGGDIIAIWVH